MKPERVVEMTGLRIDDPSGRVAPAQSANKSSWSFLVESYN